MAGYPADGPSVVPIVAAGRIDVSAAEVQEVSVGATVHSTRPEVPVDAWVVQSIRGHVARPVEV